MIFKEHELKVIDILFENSSLNCMKSEVITNSNLVEVSFSGVGYFLTVRNDELPPDRIVLNSPKISAEANGIESGFIIFIENREMMIECFSLVEPIPQAYRDWDVKITLGI